MTAPVTGIELRIGTEGVVHGREEWKRSMEELKTSTRGVQGELQGLQRDTKQTAQSQREIATSSDAAAKALRAMGLTEQQAADGLKRMGFSAREAETAIQRVGTAANTTSAATDRWATAATKLRAPLVSLAAQAVGVQGPLGSIIGHLGVLGAGAGITAGAALGVGLIARAIQRLKQDAEEAERPIREFLAQMNEIRQSLRDPQLDAGIRLANATQGAIEATAEVEKLEAALKKAVGPGQEFFIIKQLEKARRKVFEFRQAQGTAEADLARIQRETNEKRERDEARLEREREARHHKEVERQKEIQRLVNETIKIQDQFLRGEGFRPNIVTPGPTRSPTPTGVDPVSRQARAWQELDQAGLRLIDTTFRLRNRLDDINDAQKEAQERAKRLRDALDDQKQATLDAMDATLSLVTELFGVPAAASSAVRGITTLIDALTTTKTTTDPETRAVSVESVVGLSNPVALIAGASQILGGLFGPGEKDRLRELRQEFERSRDAFADIGKVFSDLERSLRSVADDFGNLVRQALESQGFTVTNALRTVEDIDRAIAALRRLAEAGGKFSDQAKRALADIEALERERAVVEQRLREQAAADFARIREDFAVRRLAAEGRDEEAEALRRQLEQQRELAALKERFEEQFTEEIELEFKRIQALEAEAEAIRKANEEAQRRADIAFTLDQRELSARGALGEDVTELVRRTQQERELAEATRQGYTEAEIARLQYIHGLEDEAAALAAVKAAQEQARRQQEFREDLAVRALAAVGDEEGARRLRRELEREREILAAVAAGFDEAAIAQLQFVHALEEQAILQKEVNDQREKELALMKAEARAFEDLSVRKLRAAGQGLAADEIAFFQQQQRELEEATTKGFSADYIAELLDTQRAERERRRADIAQRQQEEFERALRSSGPGALADSTPSVNLAVGVSESTASALRGLGQSQLVQQVRMVALLESVDRRLAFIAGRSGGSYEDFEAAFLRATEATELGLGITPGNTH